MVKTAKQIDAEIEALRARIRRLRLERKVAVLAAVEDELLKKAGLNLERQIKRKE